MSMSIVISQSDDFSATAKQATCLILRKPCSIWSKNVTSSSPLFRQGGAAANAHSFPYYSESPTKYNELTSDCYQFRVTGFDNINLGYVTSAVAKTFPTGGIWKLNREERHLTLDIADSDLTKRNTLVAESLATLRKANTFKVLEGWRDELYPVYGPGRELVLSLERSSTATLRVPSLTK